MGRLEDIIRLCCKLFPNEKIKSTLEGSLRVGGTVGSCATVGGLVGGPPGALVGGVVGSVVGYLWCKDDFKSLPQVIMELSDEEKQELYNHLKRILGKLKWTNFPELLSLVLADSTLRGEILNALNEFFK